MELLVGPLLLLWPLLIWSPFWFVKSVTQKMYTVHFKKSNTILVNLVFNCIITIWRFILTRLFLLVGKDAKSGPSMSWSLMRIVHSQLTSTSFPWFPSYSSNQSFISLDLKKCELHLKILIISDFVFTLLDQLRFSNCYSPFNMYWASFKCLNY